MSRVLSIEELRAKSAQELEIPGFAVGETIIIKVRKSRIMTLMAQGKIPNPLMGTVQKLMKGQGSTKDADITEMAKVYDLYCRACMAEPTYDEMADFITDEQMLAIFNWAIRGAAEVEPFRTDKENGSGDNDGEGVQ